MEKNSVTERLNTVFQNTFDDPSLEVNDAMTAADVEGWDSLTHINLIVAAEKEFKIRLTTGEVRRLNNVGDFISVISQKAG